MNAEFPKPGRGYLIREYLGGGAMKEAYRATSPVGFRDVAILRYKHRADEAEIERDFNILRRLRGTPYSEYLGYPETFFPGDDGALYFAEELLARPLDSLVQMRNGMLLLKIARDLCRGLQCLHTQRLKHSDLKLDNCGIDSQGRAKIFDLSSVASEPGDNIRGSILTRPPELFEPGTRYSEASDIWALGATLFALRTGDYPFISRSEIDWRIALGKLARSKDAKEREDADRQKVGFDGRVHLRGLSDGAQDQLHERISKTLPGESGSLLCQMLSFEPSSRPTASECAEGWSRMITVVSTVVTENQNVSGYLQRLKHYLAKILDDYVGVTDQQWDRLIDNYEKLKKETKDQPEINRIEELMDKIKRKRQSGLLERSSQ